MELQRSFDRLTRLVERRYGGGNGNGRGAPGTTGGFALRTPGGAPRAFGGGAPAFTIVVNDAAGVSALATLDRTTIAEAYVQGRLDLEGEMERILAHRALFPDRRPGQFLWRFVQPLLFGQVRSDRRWIARHYDHDADFYRLFLDRRHRCYSQGVFERDDEPLEDAITRKLDFALAAIEARPGDRVLDIGGGWGAFTEYAGRREVRVTSLTISAQSEAFIRALVERERLPCTVLREHLLEHVPAERYDAIVNLGVTEHLPDYPATLARYLALVKPGGRVYLDASAQRRKHDHSTFMERHLFPGNGSPLCLHDYLAELARTPLQLLGVWDDRESYGRTTRAWAGRLDAAREEIERRWGAALHRTFQLYLWGCADGFRRDMIQAYRLVLRAP